MVVLSDKDIKEYIKSGKLVINGKVKVDPCSVDLKLGNVFWVFKSNEMAHVDTKKGIEEKHMDAVTGLSGSGPAYIFMVIESLVEAGVKTGIPRDISDLLAAQTTFGSAKMILETGEHPALLKDMVTTPGGVTIDGIIQLEEGKLRTSIMKAVVQAAERSKELVLDK